MPKYPPHETKTAAEVSETREKPPEVLLELLLRETIYAEVRMRYRPTRRHGNLKEFTVELCWEGETKPIYSVTSRSLSASIEQIVRDFFAHAKHP